MVCLEEGKAGSGCHHQFLINSSSSLSASFYEDNFKTTCKLFSLFLCISNLLIALVHEYMFGGEFFL